MSELILEKIATLEERIEELEEIYGKGLEELDPSDASGGNFDDAYELGFGHGETYGQLELLYKLLNTFNG